MDDVALRTRARVLALQICVRALIEAHPDREALAKALESSRKSFMDALLEEHQDSGAPALLAELSIAVDDFLYAQSAGLIGEPGL